MAHEISRSTFFDASGKPAWHNLDIFRKLGFERQDREYTAREVYALFGQPEYSVSETYFLDPDGNFVILNGEKTILRHPTPDDPVYRPLGRASDNYSLISGGQAAQIWDDKVKLPVATMMMLRNDGQLVITAQLPDYDVKGEQIVNYLVFSNGMNGNIASRADVSATRVVCANTLAIAQSYSTRHTSGAIDRLTDFMADMAENARFQWEVMRDTYNILAEAPANENHLREVVKVIFKDPKRPDINFGYKLGYDHALENWESAVKRVQELRFDVVQNFTQAKAIGFDDDACKTRGTLWHELNAVTEVLSHSRTSDFNARAESLLLGTRNELIKKATSMIVSQSPEAMAVVSRKREIEEMALS